jgi:hypothetical protein
MAGLFLEAINRGAGLAFTDDDSGFDQRLEKLRHPFSGYLEFFRQA